MDTKPRAEDFGYQAATGFDSESGWMLEGGEEAYYTALEIYNCKTSKDMATYSLELETIKPIWGHTSRDVWQAAKNLLPVYNEYGPFGMPPLEISLHVIHADMVDACEIATARYRKGMMISSSFMVCCLQEEQRVEVWHTKNEKEDELFLVLRKKEITTTFIGEID